jgi:hypothetical protein
MNLFVIKFSKRILFPADIIMNYNSKLCYVQSFQIIYESDAVNVIKVMQ